MAGDAATEAVKREPPPGGAPAVSARIGLVVYALLIMYASWFPFTGWRNNGLPAWSFLSAPMPHYWTGFDLVTNVIAYIPLGLLAVLAIYPLLRGVPAIVAALALGLLLSAGMEAGQTFLPSRVASNLDLLTNAAGAMIGAIAGHYTSRLFLEQSRLLSLRQRWFSQEAGRGLIVLGLWPLAQIYPQAYLFGHGQVLPIATSWLGNLLKLPLDLGVLIRQGRDLSSEHYWLAESIITASGLAGAVLTMMCLFRKRSPKAALAGLLVAGALTSKSLASAVIFGPDHVFAWLTPGSQAGLLIGAMMLAGLVFAPPAAQRRVAALALITALLLVNLMPVNPYFVATMQDWSQGKFMNFNGAAQLLSLSWPFFMLWFLYHPVHRVK
ncbi:VanZ family protein [Lacisediminimonas sp.]|uniref:VanZ family protein n=1 Tax=Lacisediminimonas sp. TaxID=3060582 RepID=UPI0027175695|nr:VanZ family protein [Lacisediminimonas sp.]MDO8299381.1 VanZ family protein [Lacisediminimonas sp.]MDO9216620.1 VanZ family protein [Lacisediminimonas sp.]